MQLSLYCSYYYSIFVCRRLGVEHAATFEEVQEARNYLYEVCMPAALIVLNRSIADLQGPVFSLSSL